jgi:hypothetical protein
MLRGQNPFISCFILQVSQWTRLCELTIPLAIENFLRESSDQPPTIPIEILQLEKKLGEPVRVHNDDKLRRQKLKQQKAAGVEPPLARGKAESSVHTQEAPQELDSSSKSVELKVAFSKLTVQEEPAATNREPAHIRKAKACDLPPLEHVFAEGLYFTLADIVLLPCIHQFLVRFYWNLYVKSISICEISEFEVQFHFLLSLCF